MPFLPPYTPLTNELTSREEIERIFGETGVDLHIDDFLGDTNLEEAYFSELIQRATRHVFSYLGSRWSIDAIYKEPRLREIATYWAARRLSKRRGNPGLFDEEYAEGQEELERIREGSLYLNIPSNGPRASMQSGIVDNRYHMRQYRVLPARYGSTYVGPNQRTALWFFAYGWV